MEQFRLFNKEFDPDTWYSRPKHRLNTAKLVKQPKPEDSQTQGCDLIFPDYFNADLELKTQKQKTPDLRAAGARTAATCTPRRRRMRVQRNLEDQQHNKECSAAARSLTANNTRHEQFRNTNTSSNLNITETVNKHFNQFSELKRTSKGIRPTIEQNYPLISYEQSKRAYSTQKSLTHLISNKLDTENNQQDILKPIDKNTSNTNRNSSSKLCSRPSSQATRGSIKRKAIYDLNYNSTSSKDIKLTTSNNLLLAEHAVPIATIQTSTSTQNLISNIVKTRKTVTKTTTCASSTANVKMYLRIEEEDQDHYSDFLFATALSNGILYPKVQAPKAVISKGNNGCLVRSVLKRRKWWVIKDEGPCNMIWTQKQSKNFTYKPSHGYSKPLSRQQLKDVCATRNNDLARLLIAVQDSNTIQCKSAKKTHKRSQNVLLSNHFTNNSGSLFNVKNQQQQQHTNVNNCFPKKLHLAQKIYLHPEEQLVNIHNHLPNANGISSKKGLFLSLKNYYGLRGMDYEKYLPKTYLYDESSQIQSIQAQLSTSTAEMWIVKPGQDTNRGKGITIVNSKEQVSLSLKDCRKDKSIIIQQYVKPYLYLGRKFDIRAYLLVTIVDGKTKAYWYQNGYIRTSSFPYEHSLKPQYVHLTNDAIQKKHNNYGRFEPSNKLSYEKFREYLLTCESLEASTKPRDFNQVLSKMKAMATHVIEAAYQQFAHTAEGTTADNCFELFGLDFIIREDFQALLIQVNSNPCLETPGGILETLIPELLDNTFKIALDPIFPPQFPQKYNSDQRNLYASNKFSLIFDQTQYCAKVIPSLDS